MVTAANTGFIPVIVTVAVAFIVIVWIVKFVSGISKTNSFYRKKMDEINKNQEGSQLNDQD